MKGIWLLLLALAAQQREVELGASLERTTVRVGETVLLTVNFRAPGIHSPPEIEEPVLSGLELVSSTDRASFRYSPTLGNLREFSREYTLRVVQAGQLVIPPIRINVDGVAYETDPLVLLAQPEAGAPEIPGALMPRVEDEVAVRLWVEPETAYVGQQVTLTVAALFDPLVRSRLQRQPEYRPPDVQGFWTADLPGSPRPEQRVIGGREYFVQLYRRALFPLSAGVLRIPAAGVAYEVRRGLIYAPETFEVESAPASVFVRPLPLEGAPPDFGGAIGRYNARVWFDRADLRAGEAVQLIVEVRGSGNLSSLSRPALPEIPGMRVYESGEDAEVELRGLELAGHKRFSWVLVPERVGQYVLPQLQLPYFDPLTASYVVARTEPVTLLVESPLTGLVERATAPDAALRFVRTEMGRQPLGLAGRPAFWVFQSFPLLGLLGLLAFGRYRRRRPAAAGRPQQRRQQALRALRPLADSGDAAFFGQLRATLLGWLESRLRKPGLLLEGIVQVQHALEDVGVPPPVALQVVELLERCGRLRYAPSPPGAVTARAVLADAEKLLALVDREAVSERRLRAAARSGTAMLALATALLLPARGPAPAQEAGRPLAATERWFRDAVAAYERGDYRAAVDFFERVRAVRPSDPNLLYNLGNAHYGLDQRGRAVAYWVKALRVRPRDRDARFNLRQLVGDDPVVGSALMPLPLSADEIALLLTLLWFGGAGALVARYRWRKAYLTFVGGATLTLALLCAALLLVPRSHYAIVADPGAVLRADPVRQSEAVATATPGTAYRIQSRRGDWLRVSRGDREGWVEKAQVELID
jgi:tetratricopeptide (TPR) repeat protein